MAKPFRPAHLALAMALAFPLNASADVAARVEFTAGDVRALAADGSSRVLARGAQVGSGDTVNTGSGRAQMRFTDGSLVSLQPQTQFRIDQYAFAGKPTEDRGFFSLIKGGLRTITGLVGKGNRSNYKLTTSVATIGIRGTEFSVAYGNSVNVTTGDGAVDVCNGGGCLTVSDGQSAYVADQNTIPVIVEIKTDLPPPPPSNAGVGGGNGVLPPPNNETFLVAEERTSDGGLDIVTPPPTTPSLQTGDGYYVFGQYTDQYGGYGGVVSLGAASAQFEGATLVAASNGVDQIQKVSAVEAHEDGIIGWGRWTDGTCVGTGNSSCFGQPLIDMHYVVGKPTPDLAALGGVVATYALSGYTTPTSSGGGAGGAVSGSLTADFSSYAFQVSMNVAVASTSFGVTGSGSIDSGTSAFAGSISNCTGCAFNPTGGYVYGFFAGSAAERAGMIYHFETGISGINQVSGAAVFTKTSSSPGGSF
ncbi:FecR family protein [Methyloversatilis sp.]|uniref:FecR family protein n=1 Tax=Methyloversatilis sp. TaxID=2569862 RepID=UPI003D291244